VRGFVLYSIQPIFIYEANVILPVTSEVGEMLAGHCTCPTIFNPSDDGVATGTFAPVTSFILVSFVPIFRNGTTTKNFEKHRKTFHSNASDCGKRRSLSSQSLVFFVYFCNERLDIAFQTITIFEVHNHRCFLLVCLLTVYHISYSVVKFPQT